jgi:hypothetical protein
LVDQLIDGGHTDFFEHVIDLIAKWPVVSSCKVIVDHVEGFYEGFLLTAKVPKVCENINNEWAQTLK